MKKLIHPLLLALAFIAGVLSIRSQIVQFSTNNIVVSPVYNLGMTNTLTQADTIAVGTQFWNMTNAAGQNLFSVSQLTNLLTRSTGSITWSVRNNGNLGTYTNETSMFYGSGQ